MVSTRASALFLALGVIAAPFVLGCAEGVAPDKAASELSDQRRALDRKDVEIRAYQWQLATLAQQLQQGQARSDALQRELFSQITQLSAANAALAERLKHVEADRTAIAATDGKGRDDRGSVEALRRVLAASEAQNARVADELARIAKALASRGPVEGAPSRAPVSIDVVDPWGYSRK